MSKKIVAVCENERCAKLLEEAGKNLGYIVNAEIQSGEQIKNEIKIYDIEDSIAVIFAVDGSVEGVEKIERFIDREYYEVDPKFVIEIENAEDVINEIIMDLN